MTSVQRGCETRALCAATTCDPSPAPVMAPPSCSGISDLKGNRPPFLPAIAGAHSMELEVEEEPREPFLPLRWESTGDQWWYATPIDWAAASGHYDVVRELLRLDANLLVKLTSLRRIRRLESVWDDDARLADAARNRAAVARRLLVDCGTSRLVRAGYGGWLLYTAAAAGDAGFVRELLAAQPMLVYGEGEYGVTDVLYAAARSGRAEVFRLLLDEVLSSASSCPVGEGRDGVVFRREMINRAVHAAARGGSLDVLRELLRGCSDATAYRDVQGSTILHAAAARGQVEVVKNLTASFDIANAVDDHGNTALHIAAFRGHLPVVEALITVSPYLISARNEAGDTFLHMALTGFGIPGFRRLDRQMELVRQLISESIMDVSCVVNVQNEDRRTALHLAVVSNLHSNLVQLLMSVPSIDLNIRDNNGMTPLDLLRKQPRTASSEILIKQMILAGGITISRDLETRSAIASQLKMHCIVGSPGTSFDISDAEIFLHAGIDASSISKRTESFSSIGKVHTETQAPNLKKLNSFQDAAKYLKVLLKWPRRKGKKSGSGQNESDDDAASVDSCKSWSHGYAPTPLRERYSAVSALFNNKRTLAAKISPSRARKMNGVIQPKSPSVSAPWLSSVDKIEAVHLDKDEPYPNSSGRIKFTPKKYGSLNSRLMNQYLRLGSQGVMFETRPRGISQIGYSDHHISQRPDHIS